MPPEEGELKRTPLYSTHCEAGARMVEFGGWSMPVQYTGIIDEHRAVRERAGLFDVSHMGEILVSGEGSEDAVNYLVTNDVSRLTPGKIAYSPMCNESGGTVDDLLVYRKSEKEFLLVVNAVNEEKDWAWIREKTRGFTGLSLENASARTGQVALQGPRSAEILGPLAAIDLSSLAYYTFADGVEVAGIECLVSRTGYTGEDGFEIYCPADKTPDLWKALMEAGKYHGLVPAGLGARDTLRFEAALVLYGHELAEDISPIEAGLKRFIALDKGDFIGKDALAREAEEGRRRRLIGLKMLDRGIPRPGYAVLKDGIEVGKVTSGSFAPSLEGSYALALIESKDFEASGKYSVDVRGKAKEAVQVKIPFYRRS